MSDWLPRCTSHVKLGTDSQLGFAATAVDSYNNRVELALKDYVARSTVAGQMFMPGDPVKWPTRVCCVR